VALHVIAKQKQNMDEKVFVLGTTAQEYGEFYGGILLPKASEFQIGPNSTV
jgi:hypothetical protein